MKKITLITTLLMAMTAFGQTPKKQLTPEEKKIKIERYKAFLIKKNRERDSIYKRGAFATVDTTTHKSDLNIMKIILREDELKRAKKDTINKVSKQK
jgi:hypothetical protein